MAKLTIDEKILENCERAIKQWEDAAKLLEQLAPQAGSIHSREAAIVMAKRYRTSARAQLVLLQGLKKKAEKEREE